MNSGVPMSFHITSTVQQASLNRHIVSSHQPTTSATMDSSDGRRGSVAMRKNSVVLDSGEHLEIATGSWIERKLKPKKITARYPIKGKALLFATCGFGSLGDALFGYNSGTTLLPIV